MNRLQATTGLASLVFFFVHLTACSFDATPSSQAPVAATAQPAATPSAPAPAAAPTLTAPAAPQAGGDLLATPIAVPLATVSQENLTQALEAGGWTIGSSTATRSAMLAINITATKGGVTARINYYNPGDSYWERRLQQDHAAIHRDGEAILGVIIEGNEAGAQTLLQSLVAS
jgi:hypothetical protein